MSDLTNRFRFHAADEQKASKHQLIRLKCYELSTEINDIVPEGREKSLAMTKLEEVMFWANAAIARSRTEVDEHGVAK